MVSSFSRASEEVGIDWIWRSGMVLEINGQKWGNTDPWDITSPASQTDQACAESRARLSSSLLKTLALWMNWLDVLVGRVSVRIMVGKNGKFGKLLPGKCWGLKGNFRLSEGNCTFFVLWKTWSASWDENIFSSDWAWCNELTDWLEWLGPTYYFSGLKAMFRHMYFLVHLEGPRLEDQGPQNELRSGE